MKSLKKNIWIFIVLLTIAIAVMFFFISGNKKFDWIENYTANSSEPYGYKNFYKLINRQFGDDSVAISYESFNELPVEANVSLIVSGPDFQPDSTEALLLSEWVRRGHDVLIIQKILHPDLAQFIWDTTYCGKNARLNADYYFREFVRANFYYPAYHSSDGYVFDYRIADSTTTYDFGCIDKSFFCPESPLIPLAYLDSNYVNFVSLPHGKGRFFLHVTPLMFTNYALSNFERFTYASKVLSFLSGNRIIIDQGHIYSAYNYPNLNAPDSPFAFILSQEALRYAFYLMLFLALLFVFTASRRNQRIIPVIEPPVNSSLEFIQASGRIYFLRRDHAGLLAIQIRFLLQFIRNRYHLQIKQINEINSVELSSRSGVSLAIIEDLLNEYQRLSLYVELSDKEIVAFYKKLNHFYQNCK